METSESADKAEEHRPQPPPAFCHPPWLGRLARPIGRFLDRVTRPFGLAEYPLRQRRAPSPPRRRHLLGRGHRRIGARGRERGPLPERPPRLRPVPLAHRLGFATFARVVILLVASTLIWVPVGVKIGMSPRLSRYAQPVVQVLASFPAILLFPFITAGLPRSRRISGLRRHPADDAGGAVVHPVQRHRRRQLPSPTTCAR